MSQRPTGLQPDGQSELQEQLSCLKNMMPLRPLTTSELLDGGGVISTHRQIDKYLQKCPYLQNYNSKKINTMHNLITFSIVLKFKKEGGGSIQPPPPLKQEIFNTITPKLRLRKNNLIKRKLYIIYQAHDFFLDQIINSPL